MVPELLMPGMEGDPVPEPKPAAVKGLNGEEAKPSKREPEPADEEVKGGPCGLPSKCAIL